MLFFDTKQMEASTVQMVFSSAGFASFRAKLQRSGDEFIRRYVGRCAIIWSRRVPKSVYRFLRVDQRVNHTPGRHLLGHKDSLAVIMNGCIRKYGSGWYILCQHSTHIAQIQAHVTCPPDYQICPTSFIVPRDVKAGQVTTKTPTPQKPSHCCPRRQHKHRL